MFQPRRTNRGNIGSAVNFFELVYHSIVRSVRKQHNNAFAAIAINIMQTVIFVGVFYVMSVSYTHLTLPTICSV